MSSNSQTETIVNEPRYVRRIVEQLPESIQPRAKSFMVNFIYTIQPESVEIRALPDEEIQLEIHMAWYRDIVGHFVFKYLRWLLITAVFASAVMMVLASVFGMFSLYLALLPLGLFVALFVYGILERFEYKQHRLMKTNARLVISIPQPNAWPLVDNIELNAIPKIVDTNWSPNPVWRIFQFFTGARDLYLSMSGLQFFEGKAKVRDALIIPDIMPDDVYELKKLVFKAN